MSYQQFNSVVETYLAMEKSRGVSAHPAISRACEATGRKFNKKYLTTWVNQTEAVPDEVSRWMQLETAHFAAQITGCRISKAKAFELAKALSTPLKKVSKESP